MTSFFTHQDRARRNTRVLVLLMALSVLALGVAIYCVWAVADSFMHPIDLAYAGPTGPRLDRLLAAIAGTGLIVSVASTGRVLSLRGG